MGIFSSCCKPSSSNVFTPDAETRRLQQIEAAERRRQAEENRGIKDVEKVKRQQQKSEEIAKKEIPEKIDAGPTLRWTAN